ncbi:hypothetical protein BC628DRAFT_1331134 [Trametes gibbosa]|nr:hypothetical protein BC628DRAFT_1331134 [Trametes gibbosa]
MQRLDDDTLLHVFSFLPVASIISARKTCRRLETLSRQRIVWQQACLDQVLLQGYPFSHLDAATADAHTLEKHVLRAMRIGRFWLSYAMEPRCSMKYQASSGNGISHVRFLPGYGGRYVATVYKGIWSMISCWDIGDPAMKTDGIQLRKIADWAPKGVIFSGFVVNDDPLSEAVLAIAVQTGSGRRSIEILTIADRERANPSFKSICNIATTFRPVALKGDLIAFSDDACETVVMNWRENTCALLKGSQQPVDEHFQYNRCLQIAFVHRSVLVVRARSVELFPEPSLSSAGSAFTSYEPAGYHTFGWIDGVSVNGQCDPLSGLDGAAVQSAPLSILLRTESDDPWASDVHKLEQFLLLPNPDLEEHACRSSPQIKSSSPSQEEAVTVPTSAATATPPPSLTPPYIFPPVRAEHTSSAVRGFLRCTDIILGPCGTALWIQPRAARTAHLTGLDVHSSAAQILDAFNPDHLYPDGGADRTKTAEALCAAVFAGPLQRRHPEFQPQARRLWVQPKDNCSWSALDYDEARGRVALGSSDGSVTVLDFA